jgi:hypothetical protein
MAHAADTGTNGAPFAKFPTIGDTLIGAFGSDAGKSRRQRRNFKTGEPETKPDGKTPAMEEVLHFISMPGTTAKMGTADAGYAPIEEGTHVRYSVHGFKWGQVIDARKALPAANGFKAGQPCSGDVYTIKLIGWSATTENPKVAEEAGFTVIDGRIVLRTEDERDRYVLARTRQGGNTNTAGDYEIAIRRPTSEDKRWEQAADELFMSKPWEGMASAQASEDSDHEPFPATAGAGSIDPGF